MFTITSDLGNTYPKADDWSDYVQDFEDDVKVTFDKAWIDSFEQQKVPKSLQKLAGAGGGCDPACVIFLSTHQQERFGLASTQIQSGDHV